jgi:hypothetical protein
VSGLSLSLTSPNLQFFDTPFDVVFSFLGGVCCPPFFNVLRKGLNMRKLKYLLPLFICMPIMPDLCCSQVYAQSTGISPEEVDCYLCLVIFLISMVFGNRLFKVFINSMEKSL